MHIRNLVSGVVFGAVALSAGSALAAGRSGGGLTVVDVTIYGSNAKITVSGTLVNTAATCGGLPNVQPNAFAMELGTTLGRAQLSMAMAALLAGRVVHITGTATNGDCLTTDVANQRLIQISLPQ
jgi:hypothetical protein